MFSHVHATAPAPPIRQRNSITQVTTNLMHRLIMLGTRALSRSSPPSYICVPSHSFQQTSVSVVRWKLVGFSLLIKRQILLCLLISILFFFCLFYSPHHYSIPDCLTVLSLCFRPTNSHQNRSMVCSPYLLRFNM